MRLTLSKAVNLSILLWNIWLLPAPLSYKPGLRAKLISPLLVGHDVVVLNEAFIYKDKLREQAGYNYSATLDERSWWPWSLRPVDSGLMILSKYPFDKVEKEMFKSRGGVDRFACKGVIMVRITVDGVQVDVYGTHMQSQPSSRRKLEREQQVEQLADFINLHSGTAEEERNIIVAGDMNMGPLTNMRLYDWAYENQDDKAVRTEAYRKLRELTDLEDARYESLYWQQDINRFLVRNVRGLVRNVGKPVVKVENDMLDLSDSERYVFSAVVNG
jgi:endonuclease/exonuclease/phosphatase family metal-dependent hydrolase